MLPRVEKIVSEKIFLRQMKKEDVPIWCKWFNDQKILEFSVHRGKVVSQQEQMLFFDDLKEDPKKVQFMICEGQQGLPIGVISLSFFPSEGSADISIIVGEKNYWGKGVASSSIKEIVSYGIDHHDITTFYAGCDKRNIGSRRAFEKNGFVVFDHLPSSIKYVDEEKLYDKVRLRKKI